MTTTTTATTVPVTFAKLADGSWGVRGLNLVSGTTVTVVKRNGETSEVVVGEVTPADPYTTNSRVRSAYDLATIARAPRPTREVVAEVTVEVPVVETVPAGRYAVATEDGAVNTLAFYKVDRPTEGKWAGYVFVKLMRSDEEVRLSRAAGATVLAKIAAVGAKEASAAYGREIGSCGVCSRTLTNDDSREIGIGPDCRARLGW
jgi:hypothetical protein